MFLWEAIKAYSKVCVCVSFRLAALSLKPHWHDKLQSFIHHPSTGVAGIYLAVESLLSGFLTVGGNWSTGRTLKPPTYILLNIKLHCVWPDLTDLLLQNNNSIRANLHQWQYSYVMESTRNISFHKCIYSGKHLLSCDFYEKTSWKRHRPQRLYFVYPLESFLFASILLCLSPALSHLLVSHAFTSFSGPTSAPSLAGAFPHPSLLGFFPSFHVCIFKRRGASARWVETLGLVLVVFCVFNLLHQHPALGGRVRKHKDNAHTIKGGLPW